MQPQKCQSVKLLVHFVFIFSGDETPPQMQQLSVPSTQKIDITLSTKDQDSSANIELCLTADCVKAGKSC